MDLNNFYSHDSCISHLLTRQGGFSSVVTSRLSAAGRPVATVPLGEPLSAVLSAADQLPEAVFVPVAVPFPSVTGAVWCAALESELFPCQWVARGLAQGLALSPLEVGHALGTGVSSKDGDDAGTCPLHGPCGATLFGRAL